MCRAVNNVKTPQDLSVQSARQATLRNSWETNTVRVVPLRNSLVKRQHSNYTAWLNCITVIKQPG